jgi:hypothetical protein
MHSDAYPMNEAPKHLPSWREFARLFGILFVTAFSGGIGSYWLLHSALGQRHVFGALYRMFLYHEQHPAQYIAIVAFFYALLVAAWGVRSHSTGWRWHRSLLAIFALTLLLSSAAGGVLWTFHDMQAGYFPPWGRRLAMFEDGIVSGITLGWLIFLLSFPLNVITTFLAYGVTYYLTYRSRNA